MFNTIVTADIGATNARFAVFSRSADGASRITTNRVYSSASYEQLDLLLSQFLTDTQTKADAMVLALPGPVIDGCCRTTNLPWIVSADQLEEHFQRPIFLLNDLEAQAWGLSGIASEQLIPLYSGTGLAKGNRAIIAPGSDLGEAVLYWDGEHYHPFATEGGHCDFSPTSDLESTLARLLREQYGQARWGQLLSGPGIATIYRLLSDDADCCTNGERVGELYLQGQNSAIQAVRQFFILLGRECANLVLKSMATGGIYISGGIVPKLYSTENARILVDAFLSRPSMQALLDATPVYLVSDPDLGLIGAANYLWQKASGD